MTPQEKLDRIYELVKDCECPEYPEDPNDSFGGNMDDAYNGGLRDGREELGDEIRSIIVDE